jgi:hypothetical protein
MPVAVIIHAVSAALIFGVCANTGVAMSANAVASKYEVKRRPLNNMNIPPDMDL